VQRGVTSSCRVVPLRFAVCLAVLVAAASFPVKACSEATIACVPRNCSNPGWEVDVRWSGWVSNAQTAVDYYLDGTLVATDQQSAESGSRILQVPVSSSIGLHLIQRITQGSPVGSDDCREIDLRVVPLGFLGPWSDDPHMTPRTITLHDKPVLLAKFIPLDADCYLPECEKVVFVQVVRQYWVDTSANLHDWPTDWPVGLPNKRETAAIAPDRISSGPDAGFRIDINSVAESDPYYNGDDVSDHGKLPPISGQILARNKVYPAAGIGLVLPPLFSLPETG